MLGQLGVLFGASMLSAARIILAQKGPKCERQDKLPLFNRRLKTHYTHKPFWMVLIGAL